MDDFDPSLRRDDNDDDNFDGEACDAVREPIALVVDDNDIEPIEQHEPLEATVIRPRPARRASTHRRFVRVRVRGDAVLLKARVGQGSLIARVVDVSPGGCFADVAHSIPCGAFVELSLLHAGAGEIAIGGIVVADSAQRRGLAIRFAAVADEAGHRLRRLVEALTLAANDGEAADDVDDGDDPDGEGASGRDDAVARLRAEMAALRADNERLTREARANADAVLLVGRLQLEVERLRRQVDEDVRVDVAALGDIKRDAELAWTAIARVSDALGRWR
ncbi:MAG TPA: PilZ domain-containing protein [Myxococcota bacterium]